MTAYDRTTSSASRDARTPQARYSCGHTVSEPTGTNLSINHLPVHGRTSHDTHTFGNTTARLRGNTRIPAAATLYRPRHPHHAGKTEHIACQILSQPSPAQSSLTASPKLLHIPIGDDLSALRDDAHFNPPHHGRTLCGSSAASLETSRLLPLSLPFLLLTDPGSALQ